MLGDYCKDGTPHQFGATEVLPNGWLQSKCSACGYLRVQPIGDSSPITDYIERELMPLGGTVEGELNRGDEIMRSLCDHVYRMGAGGMRQEIEHEGRKYEITVREIYPEVGA